MQSEKCKLQNAERVRAGRNASQIAKERLRTVNDAAIRTYQKAGEVSVTIVGRRLAVRCGLKDRDVIAQAAGLGSWTRIKILSPEKAQ